MEKKYPHDGLSTDAGLSHNKKQIYIRIVDLATMETIHTEIIEKECDSPEAELLAIDRAINYAHYGQVIYNDNLTIVNAINENYSTKLEKHIKKIRNKAHAKSVKIAFWNKKIYGKPPSDCRKLFRKERKHSWKLRRKYS